MLCRALLLVGSRVLVEATIKGISYGVSPGIHQLPKDDDFFCDESAPQWSSRGRGDLEVIQAMGANSIRLYGNDARLNHRAFLDEAHQHGLKVMPGNSDYHFTQSPWNCKEHSNYDCREVIKRSYVRNLQKGFLNGDRTYHPALSHIVVMNEPELKAPDINRPMEWSRALISAMDGMLEAEREAGVNPARALPNFTVTFSFAMCPACAWFGNKPALGQMWQLRDAMLHPDRYGYFPRNNLAELYRTRFTFSFNTANPSFHMRPLFLDFYVPEFPQTPVFIGEYHWPNQMGDQTHDVQSVLRIAEETPLLLGISFFEFQVRTDVGADEQFGMLRLGARDVAQMWYFGDNFGIKCLVPVRAGNGRSVPAQVARAYGGNAELFERQDCLPIHGQLRGR